MIKKTKQQKGTAITAKPTVNFFMAEDLRLEVNQNVSAIGLYPDRVMILQIPQEIENPTKERPLLIKSLALLINVANLKKDVIISAELKAAETDDALVIAPPKNYPFPGAGRSINILAVSQPCAVHSLGTKEVTVKVDGELYIFNFEIRREDSPLTQPPTTTDTTPLPKKRKKKSRKLK